MKSLRIKRSWDSFARPQHQNLAVGARRVQLRRRVRPKKHTNAIKGIVTDECVLSLENLPGLIIDMIFEYVLSTDLAKVACISRDLYWPAVRCIYKSITVARCPQLGKETWWLHGSVMDFGTLLPLGKVFFLVDSLYTNPSLRDLVQSINFPSHNAASHEHALFPLLTNVQAYFTGRRGPRPDTFFTYLEKLRFEISRPPPISPYLVELRIVAYRGETEHKKTLFRKLARDLLNLGCHLNLRKLHVESQFPLASRRVALGPQETLSQYPHWISFLDELVSQKAILCLTALELYGTMDAHTLATIHKLRRCMDLGELRTLVLHIGQEEEHSVGNTFMEKLTKYTPTLDSLAIFPTLVHPTRPSRAICNVLENNIPNQLKELLVLYFPDVYLYGGEFPPTFDRDRIQETILRSQRNLVKLKLEEGDWLFRQKGWSANRCRMFEDSISKDLHRDVLRRDELPCVSGDLHAKVRLSDPSVDLVMKNITRFRKVLEKDLICANAATYLPHLRQYIIDAIAFDLQKGGISVNGETFLLDSKSVARIHRQHYGFKRNWKRLVDYVRKKNDS